MRIACSGGDLVDVEQATKDIQAASKSSSGPAASTNPQDALNDFFQDVADTVNPDKPKGAPPTPMNLYLQQMPAPGLPNVYHMTSQIHAHAAAAGSGCACALVAAHTNGLGHESVNESWA